MFVLMLSGIQKKLNLNTLESNAIKLNYLISYTEFQLDSELVIRTTSKQIRVYLAGIDSYFKIKYCLTS